MKFLHFWCWLWTGHASVLKTELVFDRVPLRHFLRTWTECMHCGRASRGWSYGDSYVGPRP